jgi:hypothetical protein
VLPPDLVMNWLSTPGFGISAVLPTALTAISAKDP